MTDIGSIRRIINLRTTHLKWKDKPIEIYEFLSGSRESQNAPFWALISPVEVRKNMKHTKIRIRVRHAVDIEDRVQPTFSAMVNHDISLITTRSISLHLYRTLNRTVDSA